MTSPPAMVPRAPQVPGLMLSLMNLTEPSQNDTFTPPGWFDWAPTIVRSIRVLGGLPSSLVKKQEFLLGVMMWLSPPPLPQACWAQEPPFRCQLLWVAVVQVMAMFWMLWARVPASAGLAGEVLKVILLRYTMF